MEVESFYIHGIIGINKIYFTELFSFNVNQLCINMAHDYKFPQGPWLNVRTLLLRTLSKIQLIRALQSTTTTQTCSY